MQLIGENTQSTVVAQWERKDDKLRVAYQSEAELEKMFIDQLVRQGYEYLPLHTEKELVANLRQQIERLNNIRFTDNEWASFFRMNIANQGDSIADKTRKIQEDRTSQELLIREDGSFQNIMLLDKKHIHENHLQVIHQYTPEGGKRATRYDVTILVNGLPMVHIELKRRGVAIKEAFNQINRYENDSFWAGDGLFEYVQLFIISNGTETKYYSNTTRFKHVDMKKGRVVNFQKQTSNSFEFTSYWADSKNQIINDLEDFTATFMQKHCLLNILTRYCVFNSDQELMVMRPYQIAATEAILQQILISSNQRVLGTPEAGGYIWHTTGSGKTLTSFKTAQLITELYSDIDKVLFVVDRADLDYQTVKEYDHFKKDCANSNSSTTILREQLEDNDKKSRIIITTIQKLSIFCKKNPQHNVYGKHVVIIFDECHRSQFGDMHQLIVKRFRNYHIFGFTGTPIFAQNVGQSMKTTEQVFGRKLHTYTVINAIADHNVLPFRVEYIKTMASKANIEDLPVKDIDRKRALLDPRRIEQVVKYTLEKFDIKTKRNQSYKLKDKRLRGFNAIFATESIPAAIAYYNEFQRQMEEWEEEQRLKIALIYSFSVNEDEENGILEEEDNENTDALDGSSRDALDKAIGHYNEMFQTNFSTEGDKFGNYYKDVSKRMKNRDLDMLIVVNMFLTGFDATTLNTLWVDKNLRQHGLMQAYSRTNRILNSIKTFGNIVCFRNLEEATNQSIAMFGDKDACGLVLLRTYKEYLEGYYDEQGKQHLGFRQLVETLHQQFPVSSLKNIQQTSEAEQKSFIRLFGEYLKMVNLLNTFDQFEDDCPKIILPAEDQDYKSYYLDLKDKYRPKEQAELTDINDDLVFYVELIKQVEINIDYILRLIAKYHSDESDVSKETKDFEKFVASLEKAINASPDLRNKRELIEAFVRMYSSGDITQKWQQFIQNQAFEQLNEIISENNLRKEKTYDFMQRSFQIGEVEENGTAVSECLPPMSYFGGARTEKKSRIIHLFKEYFDRFYDIFDFKK